MTRARALKEVIRARAAKTGERYTTARRHVLNELGTAPKPAIHFPSSARTGSGESQGRASRRRAP